MKKLMLAFAATAAFVSVASAEDAWFNGGLGDGSLSGGSWTEPLPEGVTQPSSSYVLENVADPLSFTAATSKAADSSQNLNFATSAKFAYSYDELPAVDSEAKAGVVVYDNKYYVLEKDGTTNNWVSTGIEAALTDPVNVSVTITNGTDGAHALYQFGNSTAIDKLVVASGNWGAVDYSGSGEVASLVGTTIPLGYPIPSGDPIPTDVGNAWATKYGIDQTKLAELLASDTKYNGRTVAESCLLGVATNADLRATIIDDNDKMLTLELNCKPVAGGRVVFYAKKNGVVDEANVAPKNDTDYAVVALPIGAGVYQIGVKVDEGETWIPVSQEVGVKGTEVAVSEVYFIGAPWDDCPVTNLFKKACCAAGDKLEVYDSNGDRWYTWSMTNGKWAYVADSGIIGDAEPELIIKKGQAVKYTTAATSEQANLYQVGDVSGVNTTPVVKGKWNLVAYPDGEIAATKLPLEAAVDQAIVLNGITTTAIYTKFGEDVYKKDGYNAAWSKESIGNVSGGFFLKTKQNELVAWPAKQSK